MPAYDKNMYAKLYSFCSLSSTIIAWIIIVIWLKGSIGGGFMFHRSASGKYFNWHPLLMSTAFLFCLPFSLSSYVISSMSIKHNKKIHILFNTLCVILAGFGLFIIIDLHYNLHKPSKLCTSIHAICGYFIILCLFVQYIFGFVLYQLKLCNIEFKKEFLEPLHKRFGFFIYLFALAEICVGLAVHTKDWEPARQILSLQFSALFIGIGMFGSVSFVPIYFSTKGVIGSLNYVRRSNSIDNNDGTSNNLISQN
eukprot:207671_1